MRIQTTSQTYVDLSTIQRQPLNSDGLLQCYENLGVTYHEIPLSTRKVFYIENPIPPFIKDAGLSKICRAYDPNHVEVCDNPLVITLKALETETVVKCTYGEHASIDSNEKINWDDVYLLPSPVDTGYLTKVYNNPPKHKRFAKDASGAFVLQDNPKELVHERCLRNNVLRDLWHISRAAFHYQSKNVVLQIEYKNGVFYLVHFSECKNDSVYFKTFSLSGEKTSLLEYSCRDPELNQLSREFKKTILFSSSKEEIHVPEKIEAIFEKIKEMFKRVTSDSHSEVIIIKKLVEIFFAKFQKTLEKFNAAPDSSNARYYNSYILKALLFQTHDDNTQISFTHFKSIQESVFTIESVRKIFNATPRFVSLFVLGGVALNETMRKKWNDFYITIEKAAALGKVAEDTILAFEKVLRLFKQLNILSLWFHTYFSEISDKLGGERLVTMLDFDGSYQGILTILNTQKCKDFVTKWSSSFSGSDIQLFAELIDRRNLIKSSAKFCKSFAFISNQFNYFHSDVFKAALIADSPMVRAAMHEYLRDFVRLLRLSMLEETSQTSCKALIKLSLALTKLLGEALMFTLPPLPSIKYLKADYSEANDIFSAKLAGIPGIVNYLNFPHLPIHTRGFLAIVCYKSQLHLLDQKDNFHFSERVERFEETHRLLSGFLSWTHARPLSQKAKFDGLHIDAHQLKRHFTIPLRQCSVQMTVVVKKDNPNIKLHVLLYSEGHGNWKSKQIFISDFLRKLNFCMKYCEARDRLLSFGFVCKTIEEVEFIYQLELLLEEFTDRIRSVGIEFRLAKLLMDHGHLLKFIKNNKFNSFYCKHFKAYYVLMATSIENKDKIHFSEFFDRDRHLSWHVRDDDFDLSAMQFIDKLINPIPEFDLVVNQIMYGHVKKLKPQDRFEAQTYLAYAAYKENKQEILLDFLLKGTHEYKVEDYGYIVEALVDLIWIPLRDPYAELSEEEKLFYDRIDQCRQLTGHRAMTYIVEERLAALINGNS